MENNLNINSKPKFNSWLIPGLAFGFLILIGAIVFITSRNNVKNLTPEPVISKLTMADFPNKQLLGENEGYTVYLINSEQKDDNFERIGELVVYDKQHDTVIKIAGEFSIFGATIVSNDPRGEYVLLSTGTYSSRGIIPLSLTRKALAGKIFCSTAKDVFYQDYIISGNCDAFENRPWGVGEAPSIIAVNLETGEEKIIAKSDLTHHYYPTEVVGDNLYYREVSVTEENEWQNNDSQKTITKIYNLLSL